LWIIYWSSRNGADTVDSTKARIMEQHLTMDSSEAQIMGQTLTADSTKVRRNGTDTDGWIAPEAWIMEQN